jgi:hypothetical protein
MSPIPYFICLANAVIAGFSHIALLPVLIIVTMCVDQICTSIKDSQVKASHDR